MTIWIIIRQSVRYGDYFDAAPAGAYKTEAEANAEAERLNAESEETDSSTKTESFYVHSVTLEGGN